MKYIPLLIIAVVAIVGGFYFADYLSFETLAQHRYSLLAFKETYFGVAALLFVFVYFVIVAFSLPGAGVASITGGFLFGLGFGTVLNVVAATLGACAIFLAVRKGVGRSLAAKVDTSQGKLANMMARMRDNEISVLFLLRLVPVVPFFAANVLPALVGVGLRNFAFTTFLGIIPGGLVYTWIGVGLGDVFDRGASPDLGLIWSPHILGPILGLAILAAVPMLIGKKGQS